MFKFRVFPVKYLNLLVQAAYVGPTSFAVKWFVKMISNPWKSPKISVEASTGFFEWHNDFVACALDSGLSRSRSIL